MVVPIINNIGICLLVLAVAEVFIFLCPHAGLAHTFLKLKKYAKKFCRKAPASSAMQSES